MKLTKIYTYWSTLGGALNSPMMFVRAEESMGDGGFGQQVHEVDIDVAEPSKADAVQAIVKDLKEKQAEHRASIALLDDRINSLLCLEHKVEA